MSVRRLAEPAVQPAAFAFNRANAAEAKKWVKKYPKGREQSAVIPLLMIAQEQEGWVTRAAIETIADMLDMPYIRALEVATFYTQFQLKPVGTRAHIQVCGTTPCMLRGSEALMQVCRDKIHPEPFHTNADGTLSWEEVECQGACVNAPMIMIFKDSYEDLTPERLGEIIDAFAAGNGKDVKPGPQTERFFSAPETGFTSLTDEKAVLKATRAKPSASRKAKGDPVPPSKSAKPKTDAIETSPAVKTPSRVKASANGEKAASVSAPKADRRAANKAEPAVEGADKPRKARTAPAKSASAKPQKPSLLDKDRPIGMERPAAPDDLRLISGVGPKIEKTLHELGIFTYGQVARWTKAERAWVDGFLKFHGRIEREEWIKQAKALAKGGEAEYVRVFGKKPR
ncbi:MULTISPECIES: NADH-quinone oxidoreductase subunit E [Nitratireductor]|uniref:NADH-quinone oxidoreductase subunit E n=1 Tax=Nitratireductor TaxID=245876 RepID=UPI000D0D427B|nr:MULTISPECIES: NADH-quinone oxidoreductase subunit E [Nitratireductor]PSM19998.1 NADH-quinone oxidoreductase subunit NuoE [Nitratireductor sp. StC3]